MALLEGMNPADHDGGIMTEKTNAQLQAELNGLREEIVGLIEEYKNDLCESGLNDARERLGQHGVKFPKRDVKISLSEILVRGLDADHYASCGSTSSEFDRKLQKAIIRALGTSVVTFMLDDTEVEVDFSNAEGINVDTDI